jgi:hypothetical protein
MNTRNIDNARYRLIKAGERGESVFVDITDEAAVEAVRHQFGNRNLLISASYYTALDPSAPRIEPLRVHIACRDWEQARISTLEVCYYINERFCIPLDCQEITLTAGADIAHNPSAGGSSKITGTDVMCTAADAEMVIIVHPDVFGGQLTPLVLVMNYQLARQMVEAGIENIDIDKYARDTYVLLPGCKNSDTGGFVTSFATKELLYLNIRQIAGLLKQPRYESMIMPRFIPEAAKWFAATCADFEKKQHQQEELRKLILQKGWQIPPCIRRLSWADLAKDTTLEACRVISGAYSFLGSHEDEIWYHILRLARRNAVSDQQRLRAIVTFAVENRMFMGCEHPLLKRFCPAGKCFLAELLQECKEPYLFENSSR